jgi:hypothetical protein
VPWDLSRIECGWSDVVKFGRHADRAAPEDQEVDVDIHLEQAIAQVQSATDAYLDNPSQELRQGLLEALGTVDQRTAASDSYEASIVGSAAWGFASKGSVIGETGQNSIAEELPGLVLQAQATLVKAAKAAVTEPGSATFDALGTASSSLAALQPPDQESDDSKGPPTVDP